MKSPIRLVRRLAAGFVLLACGAAHANGPPMFDFEFTGSGFALPSACDSDPPCLDVGAVGVADDTGGPAFPIADSWAFFASFKLLQATGNVSGTWELSDLGDGGNDLSGTFTGLFQPRSAELGEASLSYLVTAGGGLFAGATGTGASTVLLNLATFDYTEKGAFSVTAVPEASTWAMMLLGLLAVGAAARRRRG